MTEKLMVGEIQLSYFTFCEATRNQNWRKVCSELNKEFKHHFGEPKHKTKKPWWNVTTTTKDTVYYLTDFDAQIICQSNIKDIDRLAQRWQVRMYHPLNRSFTWAFLQNFIKGYCNPEGCYILEKVAMEMII